MAKLCTSVVIRYDVVYDVDIILPPWFTVNVDLLFLGRPIQCGLGYGRRRQLLRH
jgi:hypothetical protein